jgi:hypothetical protein
MKKIVSLLLAVSLMSGGLVAAKKEEAYQGRRTMSVMWNPLSLLTLTLSGSYGFAVGEKVALIVPLSLTYVSSGVSNEQSSASVSLFGIESGLGVRFYFAGQAFADGFYIQPNFGIGWLRFGSSGSYNGSNALAIGGNALLGYSWVFDSGFTMNLAGGAGYAHSSVDTKSSAGAFKIEGVRPALEFAIGYSW